MLRNAQLETVICTTRLSEAAAFYRDMLALVPKEGSEGALVFDVGGSHLRLAPVDEHQPSEHTVLGFAVSDLATVARWLVSRGVTLVRFEGLPHDNSGILTTPDGSKVCWMRDPDDNLLSVVEFVDTPR